MPVDAVFERLSLEHVLERDRAFLRALAFDGDRPWLARLEPGRVARRIVLLRAELIEVVERRQVLPRVRCFARAEWALHRHQLATVRRWLLRAEARIVDQPAAGSGHGRSDEGAP